MQRVSLRGVRFLIPESGVDLDQVPWNEIFRFIEARSHIGLPMPEVQLSPQPEDLIHLNRNYGNMEMDPQFWSPAPQTLLQQQRLELDRKEAAASIIKRFQLVKNDSNNNNNINMRECPICFDSGETVEFVRWTCCSGAYVTCKNCVIKSLSQKLQCPACRHSFEAPPDQMLPKHVRPSRIIKTTATASNPTLNSGNRKRAKIIQYKNHPRALIHTNKRGGIMFTRRSKPTTRTVS